MYSNVKDQAVAVSVAVTTTGVPVGSTVNLTTENRMFDEFTVLAKGTGAAPTTLTAALEGSIDGVIWTSLQAVTQANDGVLLFVAQKLVRAIRLNVTALTLGGASNVVLQFVAS